MAFLGVELDTEYILFLNHARKRVPIMGYAGNIRRIAAINVIGMHKIKSMINVHIPKKQNIFSNFKAIPAHVGDFQI